MKETKKREILYQLEANRNGVSPKEFWAYCKRRFELSSSASANDVDLSHWIASYEDWSNPSQEVDIDVNHEDWDTPLHEICKVHPFHWHQFLTDAYNFIMEWDDYHGYMFVREFER